jgi:hypothetical protein
MYLGKRIHDGLSCIVIQAVIIPTRVGEVLLYNLCHLPDAPLTCIDFTEDSNARKPASKIRHNRLLPIPLHASTS